MVRHLRADAGVKACLGEPVRVWDQGPRQASYPHLLIERSESRPVPADGCGIEHRLSLRVLSTVGGVPEVRAVVAAVRQALEEVRLSEAGVRTVSLGVTFADVFPGPGLKPAVGIIQVRAVTEDIGA
nr:DUF3168 domain-containing protein [Brevundimonas variabilis]